MASRRISRKKAPGASPGLLVSVVQSLSATHHRNKLFNEPFTELIAWLALARSSPSTSLADVVCSFSRKSPSTRLRLIVNSIFWDCHSDQTQIYPAPGASLRTCRKYGHPLNQWPWSTGKADSLKTGQRQVTAGYLGVKHTIQRYAVLPAPIYCQPAD